MGWRWHLAPSLCPCPLPGDSGAQVLLGWGTPGCPLWVQGQQERGSGPIWGCRTAGPHLLVPTAPRDHSGLQCQPSVLPAWPCARDIRVPSPGTGCCGFGDRCVPKRCQTPGDGHVPISWSGGAMTLGTDVSPAAAGPGHPVPIRPHQHPGLSTPGCPRTPAIPALCAGGQHGGGSGDSVPHSQVGPVSPESLSRAGGVPYSQGPCPKKSPSCRMGCPPS